MIPILFFGWSPDWKRLYTIDTFSKYSRKVYIYISDVQQKVSISKKIAIEFIRLLSTFSRFHQPTTLRKSKKICLLLFFSVYKKLNASTFRYQFYTLPHVKNSWSAIIKCYTESWAFLFTTRQKIWVHGFITCYIQEYIPSPLYLKLFIKTPHWAMYNVCNRKFGHKHWATNFP